MENIKVGLRIRPFSNDDPRKTFFTINNNKLIVKETKNKTEEYVFDYLYSHDEDEVQERIFEEIGKKVVLQAFKGYNNCVFVMGISGCLEPSTLIKMYNGSTKMASEILVGDELKGDDGNPCTVVKLLTGTDDMYTVSNSASLIENDPLAYTVNSSHILTLYDKRTKKLEDICIDKFLGPNGLNINDYLGLILQEKSISPQIKVKSSYKTYPIKITYKEVGSYNGFTLTGNGRFVLANNVLTHNSGKTHTMMGTHEDPGLIPRICKQLFRYYEDSPETSFVSTDSTDEDSLNQAKMVDIRQYKVEVTYIEIYKEKIRNLLSKNPDEELKVRQHELYGIFIQGLNPIVVQNYKDINRLIEQGNKQRSVASTNMNDRSSRSHAILTILLTQSMGDKELVSKIHLIDLAGSEKVQISGVTGENFREAVEINRSLSTLSLVINKLAERSIQNSKKPDKKLKPPKQGQSQNSPREKSDSVNNTQHIPFRDSILTRILEESLGGNSLTIMLTTISPLMIYKEESINTLRYAKRAKSIVNEVKVNENNSKTIVKRLKRDVDDLNIQLKEAVRIGDKQQIDELKEKIRSYEELIREKEKSWAQREKDAELLQTTLRKAIAEEAEKNLKLMNDQLKLNQEAIELKDQNKQLTDKLKEEKARLEQEKIREINRLKDLLDDKDRASHELITQELAKENVKMKEEFAKKQLQFETHHIVETTLALSSEYDKKMNMLEEKYKTLLEEKLADKMRDVEKIHHIHLDNLKSLHEEKLSLYRDENTTLKSTLSDLKSINEKLSEDNKKLQASISDIIMKNDATLKSYKTLIDNLKQSYKEEREGLQASKQKLTDDLAQLQQQLNDKLSSDKSTDSSLRQAIDEKEKELILLKQSIEVKEASINELKRTIEVKSQLIVESNKISQDRSDVIQHQTEEIKQRDTSIQECREIIQQKEKDIQQKEKDLQVSRDELTKLKGELTKISDELTKMTNECEMKELEVHAKDKEIAALTDKLDETLHKFAEYESTIFTHETTIENHEKTITDLTYKFKYSDEETHRCQALTAELNVKNEKLLVTNSDLRAQISDLNFDIKNKIIALQTQSQAYTDATVELKQKNTDLLATVDQLNKKIEELTATNHELHLKSVELTTNLTEKDNAIKYMKSINEGWNTNISDLNYQIQTLTTEKNKLSVELLATQQKVESIQERYSLQDRQSQDKSTDIKQELTVTQQQLTSTQQQLADTKQQLNTVQQQHTANQQQMNDLRNDKLALSRQIQLLQQKIAMMK